MGPTPPDRVTPPPAGGDGVEACLPDVGAVGLDAGGLVPVDGALAAADDGAADEGAAAVAPAPEDPAC